MAIRAKATAKKFASKRKKTGTQRSKNVKRPLVQKAKRLKMGNV